MSDYVHNKQILYPITEEYLKERDLEDAWDLEFTAEFKAASHQVAKLPHCRLKIECMKDAMFIAIELFSSDGEESGDFGRSRFLSDTEQKKYAKYFALALGDVIDPKKLKYADYCYYSCCESPNYYDDSCDDFYEEK